MPQSRVIDLFSIVAGNRNLLKFIAPFDGDGIVVLLDPEIAVDVSDAAEKLSTIKRPDGSEFKAIIAGAAVRATPALSYEGLAIESIPRLSTITWGSPIESCQSHPPRTATDLFSN